MEIVEIDHVQIAAPPGSETAARQFFGELLGLPEIDKPPRLAVRGGVWFAVGTHQLHVGIQEPFSPATKAHPALRVAGELDGLAERLTAGGASVVWDHALPDVRRFYTEDPWGNRIEFLEQPASG